MPGSATQNPARATVRRTLLDHKKTPDALSTLATVCSSGAQCPEVQSSPVAAAALADLQTKVTAADGDQTKMLKAENDRRVAAKSLKKSFKKAKTALSVYETAVAGVADGDAAVITKAGCLSRDEAPSATPTLGKVTKVSFSPGKNPAESKLHWQAAPGAASYAVEVNLMPQNPAGPFTSMGTCTRRSKLVKAAGPGAQYLARVAAIASDGTQSDWSDPILATAR